MSSPLGVRFCPYGWTFTPSFSPRGEHAVLKNGGLNIWINFEYFCLIWKTPYVCMFIALCKHRICSGYT
jgi:hypothetical protein